MASPAPSLRPRGRRWVGAAAGAGLVLFGLAVLVVVLVVLGILRDRTRRSIVAPPLTAAERAPLARVVVAGRPWLVDDALHFRLPDPGPTFVLDDALSDRTRARGVRPGSPADRSPGAWVYIDHATGRRVAITVQAASEFDAASFAEGVRIAERGLRDAAIVVDHVTQTYSPGHGVAELEAHRGPYGVVTHMETFRLAGRDGEYGISVAAPAELRDVADGLVVGVGEAR